MGNYSVNSKMTISDHIIYALLYGFAFIVSLLPFRLLFILSDFTYLILYHVVGYRKAVVKQNLRESFPEKSDEERLQIERRFYHFFCDYIFETIKQCTMTESQMRRHVKWNGLEHIRKSLDRNQSICIYLAHYCNWEWITTLAFHLPAETFVGQVYHILESKAFDTFMLKLRSKWGAKNIERHFLLRKMIELHRSGTNSAIGFIADQGPEMHTIHHWTNFLNHDTAVITGAETVAKKFDMSCVYLDIQRTRRGYYTVNIIPLTEHSANIPDFDITDIYMRELEKSIRRQPENWLWTHKRWKRTRQQYEEYLASHPNHITQ